MAPRKKSIEQKVAAAILEKADSLEIDGKTYTVAPPSLATLILVSELVATFPIVSKDTPSDKIIYAALHYARFYKKLGDLAAILVLGAKNMTETVTVEERPSGLFGRFKKPIKREKIIDHKRELSKAILENITPSALFKIIIARLEQMEIGSFFGITTSLSEVNLLTPTKEVAKS